MTRECRISSVLLAHIFSCSKMTFSSTVEQKGIRKVANDPHKQRRRSRPKLGGARNVVCGAHKGRGQRPLTTPTSLPPRVTLSSLIILGCCTILSVTSKPAHAIRTQLTWVNGIGHNLEHMDLPTSVIQDLFGGSDPEFCHNPTAMTSEEDYMGYLGDLTQAGTQKLGRITAEVNSLVTHLKAALTRVGKTGRIVHIAHSQGALITSLAARQLNATEMSRIEVIAFGGAAALRRCAETPFARCVNYYSVNDPLLALVPSAEKALRSGFLGVCSRGLPSDEPEFVFLTPRGGDPILDHGLLGPTYLRALEWEGRRFQRLYQPISHRAARAISIRAGLAVEAFLAVLGVILRNTIIAFILFVQDVNARIAHVVVDLIKVIVKPVLLLLRMLQELLSDLFQSFTRVSDDEKTFTPIDQIPMG